MTESGRLQKQVVNAFRMSGYFIRSQSATFLVSHLISLDQQERTQCLDFITEHIQNQGLKSTNVEISDLELAIKEFNSFGPDSDETVFKVINAFDVPSFKYNNERKKYMPNTVDKTILPLAQFKSEYLTDRYTMLWQRTCKHELFSASVIDTTINSGKKFQLRIIENLLSVSKLDDIVVLGLLTQLTEGKFYIEDPTGIVQLDLSEAQYHSGLFCEGCFVLVEGNYEDEKIKVAGLGFPPPELASSSRAYFGNVNTWGGDSKTLLKHSTRLKEIETSNTEATIVFLSDCWLDDPLVLEKLNFLFSGYNDCPPTAIVLMGPFLKHAKNPFALKTKLQALADILEGCDQLKKNTDLVFVPSMEDPAAAKILPRPPLPKSLCADFLRKYPRAIFTTNPCRLQYCTQQIVVCRADLITKFCRNTIHFPDTGLLADHFSRTLICQGSLTPLCSITLPTYWQYDAALSLYPLPDLIVVGDPSEGFQATQQECMVLNTGSFPTSKYTFKVYVPSNRTIEDSQIPDE